MMNRGDQNGLKGLHIIAQGKRSVALGWETGIKIVRALTSFKETSLFRTKWNNSYSIPNNVLQFCPQKDFCLEYPISADGYSGISYTQVDVSVVPPESLSWTRMCWPFRPTKNAHQNRAA